MCLMFLPTHPTLHLDSYFTLSSDSLRSDLEVSFPSGTRNKIFDPGIFFEVQSKRFLSPNEFSISFIRDPLSPVFDTLLPFSSENEDNIFNPSILASNEGEILYLLFMGLLKLSRLPGFLKPLMLACDVAESSAAAAARAPRGQYDFVDTVEAGQGLIRSPGHDARTIA
ncbi:hypothetical protein Tco_0373351 [Tanacetum coccineum]